MVFQSVNALHEIVRPKNIFPPNLWGDRFLNFEFNRELAETYVKEIEGLKPEVKALLTNPRTKTMDLIDKLERLGISYHFENEIEECLAKIFSLNTNYDDGMYDMSTVSVYFRVLRQHGYRISSGVFNKFKDGEGRFKDTFKRDARGLLNLYEAAHLRISGEDILEDSLIFAKENLVSMAPNLGSTPLKKLVDHALFQPLHLGHQRFETHHYISTYQEEESKNEMLLKFAKLNYNAVQMMHKQELKELSMWWKELDLASKLPYARERIVEDHFWTIGTFPSCRHSRGRVMLTKLIKFLSLIDDTFDAYGTIEELDKFNHAIQRWDMGVIHELPEYMKPLYAGLLNLCEEIKQTLAQEGRSYEVDYVINAFKEQVKSNNIESKWFAEGYLPPFSDYLSNALITCSYLLIFNAALMGTCLGLKEEFEWLNKKPRPVTASQEICRLISDVASYEVEKERGQKSSGIESYMMENGVEKEEAMDKFLEMGANAWKDINESMLMPRPCTKLLLLIILNCTRVIDVMYNKNSLDGYTFPEKAIKRHIFAVYIDPFQI